jgi:hypothetical protein
MVDGGRDPGTQAHGQRLMLAGLVGLTILDTNVLPSALPKKGLE